MITKVLKFSGSWCGPCRVLGKELQDFTLVPIEEIDVDENEETCTKYNIRNIPVLCLLDENDNEIYRFVGLTKCTELESKIKELNEI